MHRINSFKVFLIHRLIFRSAPASETDPIKSDTYERSSCLFLFLCQQLPRFGSRSAGAVGVVAVVTVAVVVVVVTVAVVAVLDNEAK